MIKHVINVENLQKVTYFRTYEKLVYEKKFGKNQELRRRLRVLKSAKNKRIEEYGIGNKSIDHNSSLEYIESGYKSDV